MKKRSFKKLCALALCFSLTIGSTAFAAETADSENSTETVSNDIIVEETAGVSDEYTPVQQFVIRLYRNVLNREADKIGLNDWTQKLVSKQYTGAQVSEGFIYSKELKERNLSDSAYVDMLYATFLDRKADPIGKNDWLHQLENGVSRAFVFKGFVESNEFTEICCRYGIERGNVILTESKDQNAGVTMFVWRCYKKVLGRNGDNIGLNDWTGKLISKEMGAGEVAYGFVFSEELISKNLTNEQYVKMLYEVFLDRSADKTGLNDWVGQLERGTSRYKVFLGFVYSAEFKALCAQYGIVVGVLPPEEDESETNIYIKGVWNGTLYINTTLGISLWLPVGWQIGTLEEFEAVMNQKLQMTGSIDIEAGSDTINDLYIYNPTTGASIIIVAEDLREYGITAGGYVEIIAEQLVSADEDEITCSIGSFKNITIGKSEFVSFSVMAEYQGSSEHQFYAVTEKSGYTVMMIATAETEAEYMTVINSMMTIQ